MIPPTEYILCAPNSDAHDFLYNVIFVVLVKLKSFNIERSESEEEPTIPKALIERFKNVMSEYVAFRSVMRVLYFVALQLLFICILDSNPRVSSKM